MSTLALLVGLAALVATSFGQYTESEETVWSSVAYILSGESTPLRGSASASGSTLTPLGAQQMLQAGSVFRARYLTLNGNLTEAQSRLTTQAPIKDIELSAIDNSQLNIAATDDMRTSTSAQAFMQGLYPPAGQSVSNDSGGIAAAQLANGSILDFPLGGYQYPNIQTLSSLDPMSIWIEGHANCPEYQATNYAFHGDTTVQQSYNQTLAFYRALWPRVFAGAFTYNMANYYFADELYDYAQYQWNHNPAIVDVMAEDELDLLRTLASLQQRDQNGNLSYSGFVKGDMIRAVAGRTLAARIVALFKSHISYDGQASKLNLLFGPREPFVSFFALSGLDSGVSGSVFRTLPDPGAAMVFELFSLGAVDSSVLPAEDDLWVRFRYRNSSDESAPFVEYPLFGNGPSKSSLPFLTFVSQMQDFGLDSLSGWCETCGSASLYCTALIEIDGGVGSGGASSTSNPLSPAAAGAIGALVTLGVLGLVFLAAVCFGGVRFHRREPARRDSGGFRGPETKAGDPDVLVSRSGARHERAGSWELRGGGEEDVVTRPAAAVAAGASTGAGAAVTSKESAGSDAKTGTWWKNAEDDAISVMHDAPVKPREDV